MSLQNSPVVFLQEPISTCDEDGIRELGRKAVSLHRLAEAGHRVPRGFTVRAEICRQYLDAGGQWPDQVWEAITQGVRQLERETGRPFVGSHDASQAPQDLLTLAVRSGAAESMPGLLTTVLHVGRSEQLAGGATSGTPDPWPELRSAIERVFRSWQDEPAHNYRQSQGIDHALGTAVTVQEMICCDYSGVLFTRSPGSVRTDRMTLELVAGLGDQLVAGRCDPVRWSVPRDDPQQVLSSDDANQLPPEVVHHLLELCRVGLRLEVDFANPLDIEWGIDQGGLVFFQARPISEPAETVNQDDVFQREAERLRALAENGSRIWVRHNLDETLMHPTPLTWSLWRQFMSGGGGLGTLYRRLGYRPAKRVDSEGMLELIGGLIFVDPDRATEMFGEHFPFRYDMADLRDDPSRLDRAPTRFDPDTTDPWLLWRLPASLVQMVLVRRNLTRLFGTARGRFEHKVLPPYLEAVSQHRQQSLADLTPQELITLFEQHRQLVLENFGPESLLLGLLGNLAFSEFERQLVRVLGESAGRVLAGNLVPSGDLQLLLRQQQLLAAIQKSPACVDAFLGEFGHRAVGEMELATPRWRETPNLVIELSVNREDPRESGPPVESSTATYAAALKQLEEEFAAAGGSSLIEGAKLWLDRCWEFLPYRDRGKHYFLMGYELLRNVTEELAGQFDLGSRFYNLTSDEWPELAQGRDFTQTMSQRRRDSQAFRQMRLPLVIDAGKMEDLFNPQTEPEIVSDTHEGTPLVGGQGTGEAWTPSAEVLTVGGDSQHILVCQALEPSWSPLLGRLTAVVVEQGGTLSHGAILARQWRLPVVRLPAATELFSHGQRLHVDGDTGRIQILDGEQS